MTQQEQAAVAVGAARSMLERVGSLSTAGNAEIAELLAGTAELGRIVGALQVGLAGVVEERSAAAAEASFCRWLGHRDAKEAVASAFGIRVRDARALLSMAAATMPTVSLTGGEIAVKYPRVGAALTEGGISLAQARAIVGTLEPAAPRADLEQLAWAEGALVDAATDPAGPLVPELLVTQARAYVAVLDPDGVLPNAERQRAMRSARMRELPDGMWELTMLCTPESAAVIKALLDAYTGPRVKVAFRDDDPDPADPGPADPDGVGPDAVDPDAGREVDANGQPSAEGIGVVDDRTPEQQRHDVLLGLVQAHAASGDAPVAGGEPPTLVITGTIDAYNAYLRDVPTPDRTLTIEHTGGLLPIESIGRYACDGIIRRAILDCNGHVLELGTTERRFNRAQRRALAARDKGCRVPGCRMPVAWTEAHHITPWAAGGPTDIDNGILVCSYHHHEIHAGRLRVEAASTRPGHWRIVPTHQPTGRYARTTRTGTNPTAATTTTTTAHAAAPSPTIKLPDETSALPGPRHELPSPIPAETNPPLTVRPPRPAVSHAPGAIEARLQHLVRRRRQAQPRSRTAPLDLRPTPHIVMRT